MTTLRKFPHLLIYAILEWIMIVFLFVGGLLAFISNEFAKCFGLKVPCFLCTRVDHLHIRRNSVSGFYCNDSICETHKKSLPCFPTNRNPPITRSMSQSIYSKDTIGEISDFSREQPLKLKSPSMLGRALSLNYAPIKIPSASPRAILSSRFSETRQILDNKSEAMGDDVDNQGKEDVKATIGDANRTPRFKPGNKLLGIPLNSAPASPKLVRRSSITRRLSVGEPMDTSSLTEAENDILNRLRAQVRLDHDSLMKLYMELDEERNASNIAANNAMAMITRLQAEKAAVQMEALQYQRMMEEQAEYDEEAFQAANDMLEKREEDMKALETELLMYREKYGLIEQEGSVFCEADEDYTDRKSMSLPSFGERSDNGSLNGADQIENSVENGREDQEELLVGHS